MNEPLKEPPKRGIGYLLAASLGALGVVYGDIGTSPLYALRECFSGPHGIEPTAAHIIGAVSLVFWTLTLIVSIKYLTVVFRADNRGEGGILALMVLALRGTSPDGILRKAIVTLGIVGASLLYGDGVITPAISVLSAVEGLNVATHIFEPYITAIVIVILIGLFLVQRIGAGKVGFFFGPIILAWFITIGVLGVQPILQNPRILHAFNPLYGFDFLFGGGHEGLLVLGAVFLAVTGVEALYADLGHFGKKPIRLGWFAVAFPGLVLNYLGQGALLLENPQAASNPFYFLAPSWFLYPLVILATLSTVIASQALITGAFSLSNQAIQLGFLPRMVIRHTSYAERGQIYIPIVNWFLLVATVLVVLFFHTSSSLAAAYGIAVVTTMVITSVLVFFVARAEWHWGLWNISLILGLFIALDLLYFTANSLKLIDGGWMSLIMGLVVFIFMTTWWTGRKILWERLKHQVIPFREYFNSLRPEMVTRIEGTAVFMIRDQRITPPALIHNIRHNKVIHQTVILLTVTTEETPYVEEDKEKIETYDYGGGFHRVILRYGFMETPCVMAALQTFFDQKLHVKAHEATFFIDRVIPVPSSLPGMAIWREQLFAFMTQNALRATSFYRIPVQQVIEIGFQVEI